MGLEVEVGERPENLEEKVSAEEPSIKWRGLQVEELTPDTANRLGIEEKKGVVVVDIEPNSPADAAGIIPGDVIIEINKQGVKNIPDYQRLTKGLKGDALIKTARGYFLVKKSE